MYLVVDMTSQEGSAKHQVSVVTDQDIVTTERGLLLGQQVDSILVWWFTSKKTKWSRVCSNIHLSRTSVVLFFPSDTFKVKAKRQAEEAGPDRQPKVTFKTFGLKHS